MIRQLFSLLSWMIAAYIGVTVLYEMKCAMDIDLLPGHYGDFFPLKHWVKDLLTD